MQQPTLVVMAAGMGSRFDGLKQISPVGPHGEKLIEYAIYDALRAGFGKVVFIIKRSILREFRAEIGDEISRQVPVDYVFQELDSLPAGFSVPPGREKPWGTGHAISCCLGAVDTPFAVINADDYYGPACFPLLADFFRAHPGRAGEPLHLAMVGYVLENTLTENGYVSRGICQTDEYGMLTSITERTRIEHRGDTAAYTEDGGVSWHTLPLRSVVSMNCWGFPQEVLPLFEEQFEAFLGGLSGERADKAEFYLPSAVDAMMRGGAADVKMLHTADKWYGMTYQQDRDSVRAAISRMTDEGRYPGPLWL